MSSIGIVGLVLSNFILAGAGHAQTLVNSEYQHQADTHKIELTPGIDFTSRGQKVRNDGSKVNTATIPYYIQTEYGLNDMFSASMKLMYTDSYIHKTCSGCGNNTDKGVNDPEFTLKGRMPVGQGIFFFGAHLDASVMDHHINPNGDTNEASGGLTLTPYVAYETMAAGGFLGARLDYDIFKDDQLVVDDTVAPPDYKIIGGKALTVTGYFEMPLGTASAGLALSYLNVTESEMRTGSGKIGQHDAANTYRAEIYAPIHLEPTVTVWPSFTTTMINYTASSSKFNYDVYSTLSAQLRMVF